MTTSEFRSQFADIIRSRRATRSFQSEALPEAEVTEFLELVHSAPTAFNLQDRAVVVVDDQQVKEVLTAAANGQQQVAQAPMTLVFLAEPSGWQRTFPAVAEQNLASGLWDEAAATEKHARISSFQQVRAEAGLTREFALRNAMIAASFAMVIAQGFGWASSPMTGFNEAAVKKAIGAEDSDAIVALLLAVGKPAEQPVDTGRLPLESRFYRNRYHEF